MMSVTYDHPLAVPALARLMPACTSLLRREQRAGAVISHSRSFGHCDLSPFSGRPPAPNVENSPASIEIAPAAAAVLSTGIFR